MIKSYSSVVYSDPSNAIQYIAGMHGDDQDVLMLLRLNVLIREHANYTLIITKIYSLFHSIYDYFTVLKRLSIPIR